jgi:hypothetical protein
VMPAKSGIWVINSAPIRLRRRSPGNAASLKGIVDELANQRRSDGCDPGSADTPGTGRTLVRPDFAFQHCFGPFAQLSFGRRNRNDFRPSVPQIAPPPAQRVNAQTPADQNHRLVFALPSSLYHALQQNGDSYNPRPRARLATPRVRGQVRPLDLKEPGNGYKGRTERFASATGRRALAPHRQAVREPRLPRRLALRPEDNAQPLLAWGGRAMPWPPSPPVAGDDGRGSLHLSWRHLS